MQSNPSPIFLRSPRSRRRRYPRHRCSGTTSPPPTGKRKRCPSATAASAPWCSAASSPSACRSRRNRCGPAGRAPKAATTTACRRSRRSALVRSIGKQLLDGAHARARRRGQTARPQDAQLRRLPELRRSDHRARAPARSGDATTGASWTSTPAMARVKYKQGMIGYRARILRVVSRTRCWWAAGTAPVAQKLRVRYAVPDNRSGQTRIEAGKAGRASRFRARSSRTASSTPSKCCVIPECGTVTRRRRCAALRGRLRRDLRAGRAHQLPHALSGLSRCRRGSGRARGAGCRTPRRKTVFDAVARAARARTTSALFARVKLDLGAAATEAADRPAARADTAAAMPPPIARSSSCTSTTAATC